MRRPQVTFMLAAVLLCQLACSPPTSPGANPPNTPSTSNPGSTQVFQPEVRGLVREVDGGPVPGAAVDASYGSGRPIVRVTSDIDGRFILPAQSGARFISLSVRKGELGDKYFWGSSATVPASADPSPVSIELKLQPSLTLIENSAFEFQLSDDALSFSAGYPAPFTCGPCRPFLVKPAQSQDFEVHVQASAPVPVRVLLVGSEDYNSVLLSEASSEPGASGVVLRIRHGQLESSQYPPVIYVEKPRGQSTQTLRISLVPVK